MEYSYVVTHPQLVSRRLSPTCNEAMPKSAILMLFFSSSSRFSGFRSRWLWQGGKKQWISQTGGCRRHYLESFLLLAINFHSVSSLGMFVPNFSEWTVYLKAIHILHNTLLFCILFSLCTMCLCIVFMFVFIYYVYIMVRFVLSTEAPTFPLRISNVHLYLPGVTWDET